MRIESDLGLGQLRIETVLHFFDPQRFIDPAWVAKVILESGSEQAFLEELASLDEKRNSGGGAETQVAWWAPENERGRASFTRDNVLIKVVIAEEDDQPVAYMAWSIF